MRDGITDVPSDPIMHELLTDAVQCLRDPSTTAAVVEDWLSADILMFLWHPDG
jgi:hypothetical protein